MQAKQMGLIAALKPPLDQLRTCGFHLTDRVYPRGGASAYATVQKLLERLEDKECVRRDRSAMAHVFRAAVSCARTARSSHEAACRAVDEIHEGFDLAVSGRH